MTEAASPPRGLAAWTYRSDELARLEYERVIRPSWQFVCHVNQVRQPGDFVTLDLMRDPVVVMRGKDGELRAFVNACRHRAAKLLDGEGSCRGRITCPYHGWSYDLSGALKGVPAERTFPGIDKAALGLKPVEMEVALGLVFVRVAGDGLGPSLAAALGELLPLAAAYRLEEMEPDGAPWVETWDCNWKVAVDNNLENYHVPVGHPGYHRLLESDLMGRINRHGTAWSQSVVRDRPSPNWAEGLYQKLLPALTADLPEPARRTWLFVSMAPNLGIDIYPDAMDIFQILPRSGETCLMRYPIFRRPDARREARVLRYLNARINRQVGHEDRALCARVQAGLNSHLYEPGPLSQYEHAIGDFHARIRALCPIAALPQEPPAGALRRLNEEMLAAA